MRRLVMRSVAVVLLGLAMFGAHLFVQFETGNFHEVVPGELYRSGTITKQFGKYIEENHIATVLNLRGANPGKWWYQDEMQVMTQFNVKHIDFSMRSHEELTDERAMQLIAIMRDAPKPLLVHCYSGADRSGLAAALYLKAITKQSEWTAGRQMWAYYGHVPRANGTIAMDRSFERLAPRLGTDTEDALLPVSRM
jgi:protein tyrosine/serine phosphatase